MRNDMATLETENDAEVQLLVRLRKQIAENYILTIIRNDDRWTVLRETAGAAGMAIGKGSSFATAWYASNPMKPPIPE